MEFEKIFFCDCQGEGIAVITDFEDNAVELAFWSFGQPQSRGFRNRLRHAWRILRTGVPYTDMVIFDEPKAKEFAEYILNKLGGK